MNDPETGWIGALVGGAIVGGVGALKALFTKKKPAAERSIRVTRQQVIDLTRRLEYAEEEVRRLNAAHIEDIRQLDKATIRIMTMNAELAKIKRNAPDSVAIWIDSIVQSRH